MAATDQSEPAGRVSTGHLPSSERVATLVAEAHDRFKSNQEGKNSTAYPALERVPSDLFAVCVVGANGTVYSVGDTEYEFTIMSVSKPFVFALVCQELGMEEVRQRIGVNATGFAFNSLAGIERNQDGRTNPMVNSGAIAATSLARAKRWKPNGDLFRKVCRGSPGADWSSMKKFIWPRPKAIIATEALPVCSRVTAGSISTPPKQSISIIDSVP